MDCMLIYKLLYALAAADGREAVLFGDSGPLMAEAFSRSVVGEYFPELWFELPLAGEPWCDFHALLSSGDLDADTTYGDKTFAWFAAQKKDEVVRQLALSWDTGADELGEPAVQLLTWTSNPDVTCAFLEAAGRGDAAPAYRSFAERLPQGWFACYTGVFAQRTVPFLRVECIPSRELQRGYAKDVDLLEAHLRQAGFTAFGDTLLSRCQALADTPFRIEFQFDVERDGTLGSMLGVSLRFAQPSAEGTWLAFDAAGPLMEQVEAWGLADGRWRLLGDTAFSKRLSYKGTSAAIWSFPAFLKLRWCDGEPYDAKAYLMAGVRQ